MNTTELELAPNSAPDIETMKRANPESAFDELSQGIAPILEQSKALTNADAGKLAVVKVADEYRRDVKKLRCAVEARRKELVADLNAQTKAINGAAGKLWDICEKEEARLLDIIEHAEREASRIQEEKRTARTTELTPFLNGPIVIDLGAMPDADYDALLQSSKESHSIRVEYERKKVEEAAAKAKADAEERERIRLENERLHKEAEEREAQMKAEREKAEAEAKAAAEKARLEREQIEAKARKEREAAEAMARAEKEKADAEIARVKKEAEEKAASELKASRERQQKADAIAKQEREEREAKAKMERDEIAAREQAERQARKKLEAEIATKKAAEEKAESDRIAAAKKAARAPDKTKLLTFSETLRNIAVPDMATDAGRELMAQIKDQTDGLADAINTQANAL